MNARRLTTLAAIINKSGLFTAAIEVSDYVPPTGYKYIRHLAKPGNRLVVRKLTGEIALDHDAARPNTSNSTVEAWVRDNLPSWFWHPDARG